MCNRIEPEWEDVSWEMPLRCKCKSRTYTYRKNSGGRSTPESRSRFKFSHIAREPRCGGCGERVTGG